MRKLFIALFATSLCLSATEIYKVTLFQRSLVGAQTLAPGDYRLEVNGNTAKFRQGSHSVETPVQTEMAGTPAARTLLRYSMADPNYQLREITIKGKTVRLLFPAQ